MRRFLLSQKIKEMGGKGDQYRVAQKEKFIQVRHDTSVELSMSRSDSYQGLTVAREKSFFVAPLFFLGGDFPLRLKGHPANCISGWRPCEYGRVWNGLDSDWKEAARAGEKFKSCLHHSLYPIYIM